MAAPVKKRAVNLKEKESSKDERDSSDGSEDVSSDEDNQEYTGGEVRLIIQTVKWTFYDILYQRPHVYRQEIIKDSYTLKILLS